MHAYRNSWPAGLLFAGLLSLVCTLTVPGQETEPASDGGPAESSPDNTPPSQPGPPVDPKWQRLGPHDEVWIDKELGTVIVGGAVCLREGMLEMFACPRHTKEHESIVAVNTPAYLVHTALLAVGAEPGKTVQYRPVYQPATGTPIAVHVNWLDPAGQLQTVRAQEWIRESRTGKPMPHQWVFAGSGFWEDEATGQRHYYAEGGELICVSNFSTATLDLPVQSSQSNQSLMFEALTQRVPPLGTKVQLVLKPAKEK